MSGGQIGPAVLEVMDHIVGTLGQHQDHHGVGPGENPPHLTGHEIGVPLYRSAGFGLHEVGREPHRATLRGRPREAFPGAIPTALVSRPGSRDDRESDPLSPGGGQGGERIGQHQGRVRRRRRREDERRREGGRGAIRAAISDWLAASRHAPYIAAVRRAHRRHGGAGALYIILRRRR